MDKLRFLRSEFPSLLKKLDEKEQPRWGVMSAIQMVEHMSDSFRHANGKDLRELHTPAEHVPAFQSFLRSEKEFRPGTKNPLLSEVPPEEKHSSILSAVSELEKEIADFIEFFEDKPGRTLVNPIFGELDFEGWVQLLYKHARHHLKQFGLVP